MADLTTVRWRRISFLLLPIGTLLGQEPLVTDRPDATESALVIPATGVQVEVGLSMERDGPGRGLGDATGEALLRLGLGRRFEARLGLPGPGLGEFGAKVNLFDRGTTQVGVIGSAEVALTASGSGVTPALRAIASHESGATLAAMMSSVVREPLGGRLTFEQTVTVSSAIAGPLGGFIEYAARFPSGGAEHLAHAGLTWLLSDDLQVDLHGAVPLGDIGEPFVGAGLAVRLR